MKFRLVVAIFFLSFLGLGLGVNGKAISGVGIVLRDGSEWVGTCFAVSPEIVLTAWHVLDAMGLWDGENSEGDKKAKVVKLQMRGQ